MDTTTWRRPVLAAAGLLLVFGALCIWNIFDYSPTYDEIKFLQVGQSLASGSGWQTETSVVHAPLSFYTHGVLLKPFKFANNMQRLRWARVTMLIYALALGAVVFVWASKLFGPWGGLVSLAMYCFNSNILAHSSLLTTDVIYTCFSMFLLYSYWRYAVRHENRWLIASGVSLGLALLSKYSAVLWFFLLPVIGGVLLIIKSLRRHKADSDSSLRAAGGFAAGIAAVFVMALLVLNIGYGFAGTLTPVGVNHYQSHTLARLSKSPLTSWIPIPLPYPFLIGYDAQKYISEVGHPTFLAGMHSTSGWWYYYLACFFLKMPAAFWPIMIWAAFAILGEKDRDRRQAEFILIFSSIAIVAAGSFLSNSHAGFRYVLASLPPLFVLSGAVTANAEKRWKRAPLVALLCLYVTPALLVHPHHIAYFSELAGGPKNGYKWLSDSNLDWGQDLDLARDYVRKSDAPVTVNPGIMPVSGRILISATTLQDTFSTYDIHGWLRAFRPIDYIGYSWLVFDIGEGNLRDRTVGPDARPEKYYRSAFEYERDHLQSAGRLASSLLAEKPEMPEALYFLGLSQMGLGELEEAEDSFARIPTSHPLYVDARSNMSFLAAVLGNNEASKTYGKQAMMEDTFRAYARRPTPAIENNTESSATAFGNWILLNNMGVSEWSKGMLSEAGKHIRLAIDIQPNFVEAYANLAIVFEEQGRFDDALRASNEYKSKLLLLRTTPYRDYRVYYEDIRVMLGDTLELFPKPDGRVLQLKSYLAQHPADLSALNHLSIALMKQGRFGEAFEMLNRGLGYDPGSSTLYTNLAVLYAEKKMFSHALFACEQAVRIDPNNSSVAELLSVVRKRLAESGKEGPVTG